MCTCCSSNMRRSPCHARAAYACERPPPPAARPYDACRSRYPVRPITCSHSTLRTHFAIILVGDFIYGGDADRDVPRLMLHAWRLYLPFRLRSLILCAPDPLGEFFTPNDLSGNDVLRWHSEHADEAARDRPPPLGDIPQYLLDGLRAPPPAAAGASLAAETSSAAGAAVVTADLAGNCDNESIAAGADNAEHKTEVPKQ